MKSKFKTFYKSVLSCIVLISFSHTTNANPFLLMTPIDYSYVSNSLGISKVKQVKTNLMIVNGKKSDSTKIEYIKAKAYDYHEHGFDRIDDYRIFEKYKEGVNAYVIHGYTDEIISVHELSRFNQNVQMAQVVRPKGFTYIASYELNCKKERLKKPNLTNEYYYSTKNLNGQFELVKLDNNNDSYITKNLDLFCKHTYTDKTNGKVTL